MNRQSGARTRVRLSHNSAPYLPDNEANANRQPPPLPSLNVPGAAGSHPECGRPTAAAGHARLPRRPPGSPSPAATTASMPAGCGRTAPAVAQIGTDVSRSSARRRRCVHFSTDIGHLLGSGPIRTRFRRPLDLSQLGFFVGDDTPLPQPATCRSGSPCRPHRARAATRSRVYRPDAPGESGAGLPAAPSCCR